MTPELPHPAWPLRFERRPDGTVGLAAVEQDTDVDRESRTAVVLCTPRGHRDDDPSFGVTPLEFQQGPVDLDRLAAEVNQADPGLNVSAREVADLAEATVRQIDVHAGAA